MEICQACNKVGDHLMACEREDCPVAAFYRLLQDEGEAYEGPPITTCEPHQAK